MIDVKIFDDGKETPITVKDITTNIQYDGKMHYTIEASGGHNGPFMYGIRPLERSVGNGGNGGGGGIHYALGGTAHKPDYSTVPKPKKVIFNDPATIILWKDGTKTVAKCQPGDTYDKEKGVALCYMKKALGGKSEPFKKAMEKALKEALKN